MPLVARLTDLGLSTGVVDALVPAATTVGEIRAVAGIALRGAGILRLLAAAEDAGKPWAAAFAATTAIPRALVALLLGINARRARCNADADQASDEGTNAGAAGGACPEQAGDLVKVLLVHRFGPFLACGDSALRARQ